MRVLSLIFFALILLLQYPIWLGKGGWLQAHALSQELESQRTSHALLKSRNDALAAEVVDLKTGLEAVEERARTEMGMVKKNEIYFQFQPSARQPRRDNSAAPAR